MQAIIAMKRYGGRRRFFPAGKPFFRPVLQKAVPCRTTGSPRWNRQTYIIVDEGGALRSYILLCQTDDEHFEFTAYSYLESQVEELSGVARISGREASFTSDAGAELSFSQAARLRFL